MQVHIDKDKQLVDQLSSQLDQSDQNLGSLELDLQSKQEQRQGLEDALVERKQQHAEAQLKLHDVTKQAEFDANRNTELEAQMSKAHDQIAELKAQLRSSDPDQHQQQLGEYQAQQKELANQLAQAQEQWSAHRKAREQAEQAWTSLNQKLQTLQDERESVIGELSDLRARQESGFGQDLAQSSDWFGTQRLSKMFAPA